MVAVAITESLNDPPVSSNLTWVTPAEALASSTTGVPETAAPFEGTRTAVLGACAPATSSGTTHKAAVKVSAAPTTARLDTRIAHLPRTRTTDESTPPTVGYHGPGVRCNRFRGAPVRRDWSAKIRQFSPDRLIVGMRHKVVYRLEIDGTLAVHADFAAVACGVINDMSSPTTAPPTWETWAWTRRPQRRNQSRPAL